MNALPVQVYKRVTGDRSRKLVTKTSDNAKIVAYGDVSWPIEGTVIMKVWRHKNRCFIKVNLVEVHSCIIRLCLVKMTDNDEILKPSTSSAEVYSTGGQEDLPTMDDLVREFLKCQ